MNRQLAIFLIFFGFLLATFIVDFPYSNFIATCMSILFFGYQFTEFRNLAKKHFEGDFIFRRQNKKVSPILIFLAILATVAYFINGKVQIVQIVFFWLVVIFDIATSILTKKIQPIAIIISGDNLLLNNQSQTKRNLSKLQGLSLNGVTEEIKMTFVDQKKLYIKRSDFNISDIEKLIEICKERSEGDLSLSDNLKNSE